MSKGLLLLDVQGLGDYEPSGIENVEPEITVCASFPDFKPWTRGSFHGGGMDMMPSGIILTVHVSIVCNRFG